MGTFFDIVPGVVVRSLRAHGIEPRAIQDALSALESARRFRSQEIYKEQVKALQVLLASSSLSDAFTKIIVVNGPAFRIEWTESFAKIADLFRSGQISAVERTDLITDIRNFMHQANLMANAGTLAKPPAQVHMAVLRSATLGKTGITETQHVGSGCPTDFGYGHGSKWHTE